MARSFRGTLFLSRTLRMVDDICVKIVVILSLTWLVSLSHMFDNGFSIPKVKPNNGSKLYVDFFVY